MVPKRYPSSRIPRLVRWGAVLLLAAAFCWPTAVVPEPGDGPWPAVTGPCGFRFPRDHGSHPRHRTEWWYYTGNLADDAGGRYGYQLTVFRRRLRPPRPAGEGDGPQSAWRTGQVFMAHAALTDVDGQRHRQAGRLRRGALGLAGVDRAGDQWRIHVGDWEARLSPGEHRLIAGGREFRLRLSLKPLKPPVAHGRGGYSRKGPDPGHASCYYSFTRLETRGTIVSGGRTIPVSGLSWMDHEYASSMLAPGLAGWDWFSLQLDDGREVMLFALRDRTGGRHPVSAGTLVGTDGTVHRLRRRDFRLQVLAWWTSPRSGAVYPARWRLTLPAMAAEWTLAPAVADQEMAPMGPDGIVYWEGSVTVEGTAGGAPTRGSGYVEMTGYARPFDTPM